jgi:hypothetical protein
MLVASKGKFILLLSHLGLHGHGHDQLLVVVGSVAGGLGRDGLLMHVLHALSHDSHLLVHLSLESDVVVVGNDHELLVVVLLVLQLDFQYFDVGVLGHQLELCLMHLRLQLLSLLEDGDLCLGPGSLSGSEQSLTTDFLKPGGFILGLILDGVQQLRGK